jgi:HYR domain
LRCWRWARRARWRRRRRLPGRGLAVRDRQRTVIGGVQPDRGLLATANANGSTVSVFSVGSGGALTAVAGSPFATGSVPVSVAFSPSGGLLATANAVSVYADSDLALTNVPANITTGATGPRGAIVNYTPPTATDEDSAETPTVGCLPASGWLFAIATTTVTCTATDADDYNSPVTATFTVTVKGALAQLQALLASVSALPSSTAKTVLSVQLEDVPDGVELSVAVRVD